VHEVHPATETQIQTNSPFRFPICTARKTLAHLLDHNQKSSSPVGTSQISNKSPSGFAEKKKKLKKLKSQEFSASHISSFFLSLSPVLVLLKDFPFLSFFKSRLVGCGSRSLFLADVPKIDELVCQSEPNREPVDSLIT
jgi:hypothetical protein